MINDLLKNYDKQIKQNTTKYGSDMVKTMFYRSVILSIH